MRIVGAASAPVTVANELVLELDRQRYPLAP